MPRLLLLLVFALWMVGAEAAPGGAASRQQVALFLGGYGAIVVVMVIWGRRAARQANVIHSRAIARFHWGMWVARQLIPTWFAVGLFVLHWVWAVDHLLAPIRRWPADAPAALVGTLPAVIAWIGLIWAQFPIDQSLREQNVLGQLDEGLPVHALPGLWAYIAANLRLQVLFTAVPVAMILILRDVAAMSLWMAGKYDPASASAEWIEPVLSLGSAGVVFLAAPELLRRVLHTRPLANTPLRQRLEAMCRRVGIRYRDILLWHTDNHMGNAAVMGVIPGVRYILLSDLLLETMSDRQIEAVFAHELGHAVHRHMTWYGVFVVVLLLAEIGPGKWVGDHLGAHLPGWIANILLPAIGTLAGLALLFGVLSRFFERQADVYAARTMEWNNRTEVAAATATTGEVAVPYETPGPAWHVGEYGAKVFSSALYRVAVINNIPIAARNFSHGSIEDRIEYLRHLSGDPALTTRFDRFMGWVYITLVTVLVMCGVWAVTSLVRG